MSWRKLTSSFVAITMPKVHAGLKRPRDPVQLGKLIGDILTSQIEDAAPILPEDHNKDQAAVSLGGKGGLKGGRARADSLTPGQRIKIAQEAAKKRWAKQDRT
jgi:hypothetical protein